MENPFGITREEILELASNKLVEQVLDDDSLQCNVVKRVNEKVDEAVKMQMLSKIDALLMAEMEKLMAVEICPVNLWGEREGKPTTIRATLAARAATFWEDKVDGDGKRSSYGGSPRFEWLFNRVINDQFQKVVQQNITDIVGAFKVALTKSSAEVTAKHINDLIKVKTG